MKYILTIISVFILYTGLFCQIIGGTAYERAFDMCVGDDGNLYLAGYSSSYGNGNRDCIIVKYNPVNASFTYNTWGKSEYDEIRSIETYNSKIICAGFSFWRDGKSIQSIVASINSQLEYEWVKDFGNWHYQHAYKILGLENGNLLAGGIDRSIGLYGPYLVCTNNSGDLIWEKTYADFQPSHVVDMFEKQNGNILLICSKGGFFNLGTNWHSSSSTDADVMFIEINNSGDIVSDTVISALHHDIPVKAIKIENDSFYLLSHTQSYDGNGSFDICLQKFDSEFNLQWTRTYGTEKFEYASDFELDNEGNLHIIGTSAGFRDYPVLYYLKTSSSGDLIESQTAIPDYKCYGAAISLVDTNIYLLGTIFNEGSDSFVLLKNFDMDNSDVFWDIAYAYPNPVSEKCKIMINNSEFFSGTTKVEILDLNGRVKDTYKQKFTIDNTSPEFDFSDYPSGEYIIRLKNKESKLTVKISVAK